MTNLITSKEKDRIDAICKEYNIENYIINNDGSIDVDESVNLSGLKLSKLPIKFRNVSGDFSCNRNNLSTLEGCPNMVEGEFNASYNPLTTLFYCPSVITGGMYIGNDDEHGVISKFMSIVSDKLIDWEYDEEIDLDIPGEIRLNIFLKYQSYYEVWTPEFNEANMLTLVEDINNGLL